RRDRSRELQGRRSGLDAGPVLAHVYVDEHAQGDPGRCGGTGTSRFALGYEAITDVQPGSYAVMDAQYGAVEGLGFGYALTVLATVISVRGSVAILDAGYKSLSDDAGPPRLLAGSGTFTFAGDEFGKLTAGSNAVPGVGDKVRLIPGHCDTTINLHDEYVVHRAQGVIDRWPIVARGKSR
ncbi:MAG: DSD1 family PLP-dependent enzyme, partial [Candidatus Velthaea sp.]